jgi:transcription antitermination factor NusG
MERNWYIACTKQQQEQNVMALLTIKGIENFCPYTSTERVMGASKIAVKKPIFNSLVFVYITEDEIVMLKKIKNITSTVYWKSKPAIIKPAEINAIKMLADSYVNITLEKSSIGNHETVSVVEDRISHTGDNFTTIKPIGLSVTLSSLGYTLIAKRAKEPEAKSVSISQKQYSLTTILARRLYPLLMFGL